MEILSRHDFPHATADGRSVGRANDLRSILREAIPGARVRRLPVRSSYLPAFLECPRKFLLKYRCGLHRKGEFAFALRVGTVYHALMAEMVGGETLAEAARTQSHLLQDQIEEWKKMADPDSLLLPSGEPVEKVLAESEKAYSLAKVMAEVSAPAFINNALKGWKPLLIEKPIEVRIKGLAERIRCKPDLVLERESDGHLMIVDYKTVSGDTAQHTACYLYDFQLRLERAILRLAYPQKPTKFFLHNVIEKTRLRFPAKKYPTWEDYLQAVRDDYEKKALESPNSPPFLQSLIALVGDPTPPEVVGQLRMAGRACGAVHDPAAFFRSPSPGNTCFGKYNNQPCQFLPLCQKSMQAWPEIIEARFHQHFREDEEDDQ